MARGLTYDTHTHIPHSLSHTHTHRHAHLPVQKHTDTHTLIQTHTEREREVHTPARTPHLPQRHIPHTCTQTYNTDKTGCDEVSSEEADAEEIHR